MAKYKVNIECDYVQGRLRYGHLEGIIDVENEDELKEMIADGSIRECLELVVDDYRVDDYGVDMDSVKWEIEE